MANCKYAYGFPRKQYVVFPFFRGGNEKTVSWAWETVFSLNGAGDGNRTHVVGLEGRSITIMLHPHFLQCVVLYIPKSLFQIICGIF